MGIHGFRKARRDQQIAKIGSSELDRLIEFVDRPRTQLEDGEANAIEVGSRPGFAPGNLSAALWYRV
jgi:hypothetical protein